MNIWPFKKRNDHRSSIVQRELELQSIHRTLAIFESICTSEERDAYMGELRRQGYQGGSVYEGVMWNACMKAAPEKLAQAERMTFQNSYMN